MWNRFMKNN